MKTFYQIDEFFEELSLVSRGPAALKNRHAQRLSGKRPEFQIDPLRLLQNDLHIAFPMIQVVRILLDSSLDLEFVYTILSNYFITILNADSLVFAIDLFENFLFLAVSFLIQNSLSHKRGLNANKINKK